MQSLKKIQPVLVSDPGLRNHLVMKTFEWLLHLVQKILTVFHKKLHVYQAFHVNTVQTFSLKRLGL